MSEKFDIVFSYVDSEAGGTQYKFYQVARDVERPFVKRWTRAETSQQLLNQSENPQQKSRPDNHASFQKSWAGGANWWRPVVGINEVDTYYTSNHLDTWSEPGKLIPMNQITSAFNINVHDNCIIAVGTDGKVFAIGSTENDTTGFLDVYVWTPASDAFVQDTGLHSGVDDDDNPMAMVFDPSDGYFYVLTDDPEVVRFNPGSNAENAAWISSGFTLHPGANIFLQGQSLMFYSGDQVYSIDKTAPSVTSRFDDGMGPDFLTEADFTGAAPIFRNNLKLACATPEGIYYVKNTRQGSQPVAWIYRVEKDVAGTWIGNPIGSLPIGTVALGVTYHLGQLLISTTPNWQTALINDDIELEIELYFIGEGGIGSLGSILGNRDQFIAPSPTAETPYAFLGTQGPLVYIAGRRSLWVYDAIRGGIHRYGSFNVVLTNGAYTSMAWVTDSDGDGAMIFLGTDRINIQKTPETLDLKTVTNFGDDETYYTLESNFYDAGLPMEVKRMNRAEIMYDKLDPDEQEWTLQSASDGETTYADLITTDNAQAIDGDTDSSIYAYDIGDVARARYFATKLIYQTKTNERIPLRSVMLTFVTGEMVREWEIVLDAREQRNYGNDVIHGRTIADRLDDMLANINDDVIFFLDNFSGDEDKNHLTDSYILVKIMNAEELRQSPKEGLITLVLRESPLTSVSA